MNNRRTRLALAGILTLALSVTAGIGVSAEAKKKKKVKPVTFSQTVAVNQAIPDAPVAAGPSTPLRSEIVLGGKFKGKVINDLDVTFQTTGSAAGAASELSFKLTAPNKRTVLVFESAGGQSIGPLTIDDDTKTSICDSATATCRDPDATLLQPFAGTANNTDQDDDLWPMSSFNGVPVKGTWQLTVYDSSNALTSTLNSWGLKGKGVTAPK